MVTVFHGTPASNRRAILKEGLKIASPSPQGCAKRVRAFLRQQGYTPEQVPEWVWGTSLGRCLQNPGKIFVTPDLEYARYEGQASKEPEALLLVNLRLWKEGLVNPTDSWDDAMFLDDLIEPVIELRTAIFVIDVPESWLEEDPDEPDARFVTRPIPPSMIKAVTITDSSSAARGVRREVGHLIGQDHYEARILPRLGRFFIAPSDFSKAAGILCKDCASARN